MKLSIIIPVYNEERTIEALLARVAALPLEMEILVVDDGSGDGTAGLLERCRVPGMQLFRHPHNRGKGAAIRSALPHATGQVVIIQDADLEYDPEDYPKLLAPLERQEADVVYGSRFLGRGHRASSRWHYFVNRSLTELSNLLTGLRLTDMETCYKAFRTELLQSLELVSEGFEIEPEMTIKAARRGARFREVAVSYRGRAAHEGKKIGWRDGLRTVRTMLRFGLSRGR